MGGDLKSNLTLIDINNISFYLKIANITDRVQHAIFDRQIDGIILKVSFVCWRVGGILLRNISMFSS